MSANDGNIHIHDDDQTPETVDGQVQDKANDQAQGEDLEPGKATSINDDLNDIASSMHEHGKADRRAMRGAARNIGAQVMNSAKDFTNKVADAASKATRDVSQQTTKAAKGVNENVGKAASAASKVAQATVDMAGEAAKGAADVASKAATAAADVSDKAADSVDAVSDDLLKKAQDSAKDWQDRFLRLHAEWDTYRRRTNAQREEDRRQAGENIVKDLLPVIDDFERSIEYAVKNGSDDLLEGVQKVHTKMVDVLTSNGVEVIDPKGQQFDALQEQAVAKIQNADVPDETVNDVYQKGYKMGKKVIRPAMVTVTTGGPKPPKDDKKDTEDDSSSDAKE